MDRQSEAYLVLGAAGVPGLGEMYLLLFVLGTAAAVIPAVFCYRGGRGRTPIIWRPIIYVLAVLIGVPAGAAGAYYAIMVGGRNSSVLTYILTALPGLFIGAGLVPFGIARLLTRENTGWDRTPSDG
jgi:hypothetical protein